MPKAPGNESFPGAFGMLFLIKQDYSFGEVVPLLVYRMPVIVKCV